MAWPWDWAVDRDCQPGKETISGSFKSSGETTIKVQTDGKWYFVLEKKNLVKLLSTPHEAKEPLD